MSNQNQQEQQVQQTQQTTEPGVPSELLQAMEKDRILKIVPEDAETLKNTALYTKLGELPSEQKLCMSGLVQNVPSVLATGALASAYRVEFPKGLPHTLMVLKQGGFGSSIVDNGKIVGTASLYAMTPQAVLTGVFSAMSVVCGMFFLKQINQQLQKINMKLDKILEFLYADKYAELVSEMYFVNDAHDNYASFMAHEEQRIATIAGLQAAKKVAMKNMAFYANDLNSKTPFKELAAGETIVPAQNANELASTVREGLLSSEGLELSQKLYVMSSILEAYFAQNQDINYLEKIEKDIEKYIGKSDKQISLTALQSHIAHSKNRFGTTAKNLFAATGLEEKIKELSSLESDGGRQDIRETAASALKALAPRKDFYYLPEDGSVYAAR